MSDPCQVTKYGIPNLAEASDAKSAPVKECADIQSYPLKRSMHTDIKLAKNRGFR
jgi:hypothetical protein